MPTNFDSYKKTDSNLHLIYLNQENKLKKLPAIWDDSKGCYIVSFAEKNFIVSINEKIGEQIQSISGLTEFELAVEHNNKLYDSVDCSLFQKSGRQIFIFVE